MIRFRCQFYPSQTQCTATVPAVHCIRPRSALHPFPQCTATAPAVHCNRPRSALHPPPQCTASVLAVHCIRSRKYLHPFPQVLATIPASTCNRPCKYLQENTPSFRMTFSSPMFFLLTKTSAIFIGQNQKRLSRILLRNSLACASGWA